jgi:tetratricopeptide (TPR) repeat protein
MKKSFAPKIKSGFTLAIALSFLPFSAKASFQDVNRAYVNQQYFTAARLAFNDANHSASNADKAMAYYWVTQSLVHAGLEQSAVYFFLRTLQIQDRIASRKVLELAPLFIERVGPDLMRKFLIKLTHIEDYTPNARNAFYMVLAKEKLLKGDFAGAVASAAAVQSQSNLYPIALQVRATAEVMLNQQNSAIQDFEECARVSKRRNDVDSDSVQAELSKNAPSKLMAKWNILKRDAARDLHARCVAGQARTLYEMNKFEEADRLYDQIPKASFVWTDTLFEHAWTTYAEEEYNRTLGKLVSYKSPALSFVFNPEIDVLMAQSYAALCVWDDSSKIINDFSRQYAGVAKDVKAFVDTNPTDMRPYYQMGRTALADKLHTDRLLHRFMNRFVRAPYFQSLALSEDLAAAERIAIQRIDAARPETSTGSAGFPGFLNLVLDWRVRTIQLMGGIYVKNSMIDYHQILISDFEKMQFMKIDILGHQKQKLMEPEAASASERGRGNRVPVRRKDQLLWTFNGEFWNDELGDYVFALESECGKTSDPQTDTLDKPITGTSAQ